MPSELVNQVSVGRASVGYRRYGRRNHTPDDVADIVGDQQRRLLIERNAHWPPEGIAIGADKAG